MKTKLPFLSLLLVAAVALAAPGSVSAKEKKSPSPAATAAASPAGSAATKKPRSIPYHGKVASVDTAARTFMVGARKFTVTNNTKITKDGAEAMMSDITAGEQMSGSYWKKDDGTLEARSVKLGEKKMESSSSTKAQKKESPSGSAPSDSPKP